MSGDPIALTPEQQQAVRDAAKQSPIEYGRARLELARRLGCGVRHLDAEVAAIRGNGRAPVSTVQGTALAFRDPEPWPSPVEGAALLADLVTTFSRYLALADHADAALALWTVHAHAHDAAQISPVLAITSPVLECGKTTALEVMGALVPRPLPTSNVTVAALFRAVERYQPTLLVDEADTFLRRDDELRGVLNSGHSRQSAYVVRTVGDDHDPATFRTWAAKAIAMIGRLPATLASRSIEIRMRRRLPDEVIERHRRDRLDALEPLRRQAWTWAREHLDALRAADPSVPEMLHDRAADNWRPLLAIADLAGGEWPARARAAALALSGAVGDDDTESVGPLLLADLRDLFEDQGTEYLASATVVAHLATLEHRPWPEWRQDRPMTARQLARVLQPFGVRPRALWIDGRTVRGYRPEDLTEALQRYAPLDPQDPQEPSIGAEKSGFEKCKAPPGLADAESGESPMNPRALADLADKQAPCGQGGWNDGRAGHPRPPPCVRVRGRGRPAGPRRPLPPRLRAASGRAPPPRRAAGP